MGNILDVHQSSLEYAPLPPPREPINKVCIPISEFGHFKSLSVSRNLLIDNHATSELVFFINLKEPRGAETKSKEKSLRKYS